MMVAAQLMASLSSAVCLFLAAGAGRPDPASEPTKVEGVTLKVPSAWRKQPSERETLHYEAPTKDASFQLSVYPVEPRRDAKLCVDQLVEALSQGSASSGWERFTVGRSPAARRVTSESVLPDSEGQASPAPRRARPVEVQTTNYVGCNGVTKWALTFTQTATRQKRYSDLARQLVSSIAYSR